MEEDMPSSPIRPLNLTLLALTAFAALSVPARADEALFKSRCAECHSRAQTLARGLPGKTAEEKSERLAKFLESHHAPSPEEHAALVSYLVGLADR
jgi:mono/diheme cytochrome c family protein